MKGFLLTLLLILIVFRSQAVSFSLKKCNPLPFKLKQSYYQSWVVSDNEKGTDIVLELRHVKEGVTFDSVIFRGIRLKALVTANKREVTIKSILPSGKSRIKIDFQVVSLPDQLIFHQGGERKTLLLKQFIRKETRSY